MANNHIYLVLSATPYRMGRMIRRLTGETYNHASIALDRDLKEMYSFARRHYHTPFYGGFVKESFCRYQIKGLNTHIQVFKIPVTAQCYSAVQRRLRAMYTRRSTYLYNHFSAALTPAKKLVPVKNAFTCVEFCVQMLHLAGLDIAPDRYHSITDLKAQLQDYIVYTGPLPKIADTDPEYFAPQPFLSAAAHTAASIAALFPRIGK